MKNSLSIAALALAVSLFASSQIGCTKREENKSTATSNVSEEMAPRAKPDVGAIEKELTQMERDWGQAVVRHNADATRRIEADDIVSTAPNGTVATKQQDIQHVQSGNLTADAWDEVDMKVNVLDADAAVVTGRSIIKNGKYKAPDGKVVDISGQYRFTDTFARRNGQWQIVASQGTKIEKLGGAATPTPGAKASPTPAASPSPRGTLATVSPSPVSRATPTASPARSRTP